MKLTINGKEKQLHPIAEALILFLVAVICTVIVAFIILALLPFILIIVGLSLLAGIIAILFSRKKKK